MAEYYLISQLPSLDGISENAAPPITENQFEELCERLLGKKAQRILKEITLLPPKVPKSSGSALIDAWNEKERNLRLALCKVRSEKMSKIFASENESFSDEYIKVSKAALEMENPMEAEKYLNNYRLQILETLRPIDNFSEEYIYYYGIKLKLIQRIRQFDTVAGEEAYKSIYNSILNGYRLEAKQ